MKEICVIILTMLFFLIGLISFLIPISYVSNDIFSSTQNLLVGLGSVFITIPAAVKLYEFFDKIINDKK